MARYITSPPQTTSLPPGIPYIVGNEAAERFSFYGMKTVLFVFMTQHLMSASGVRDVMTPDEAKTYVHAFVASAYFFPLLGAMVSDAVLGKYRTILSLSIVYCLGHLALALGETRWNLAIGLTLIAVGTGAIKPCVSAHVGDQFGTRNQHLVSKVFGWFYFAINFGSAASTWLTPFLLADPRFGPAWAFGVPGVLMALATYIFWLGRHKFVHIPPAGTQSVKQAFSGEGLRAICNLLKIYIFVAIFWSLFDQTGSAWIQQARRMDRVWLGRNWLPSQIQTVNPILIMILIPLFSYVVYPLIGRAVRLTSLRKVSIGFFLTVAAFAISAWIETQISGGYVVSVTSEGNVKSLPAEKLIDGHADGSGWVSSVEQGERTDQQIVFRLRERRTWPVHGVRVNPYVRLGRFLESAGLGADEISEREVRNCWAAEIEIYAGDTPLGDCVHGGSASSAQFAWRRKLAVMDVEPRHAMQSVSFPAVDTEYIMLRITRAVGGDDAPCVGLGEVQIVAEFPSPDARQVAAVWPNVAAAGHQPHIRWQILAYLLLTAAEIMVSITCLEFSYTQAPNTMKSFVMSLYLLSVSVGNLFTAAVNRFIQNEDTTSKLEGAAYYWFFTGVMLVAALGFVMIAKTYRGKTYIQGQT